MRPQLKRRVIELDKDWQRLHCTYVNLTELSTDDQSDSFYEPPPRPKPLGPSPVPSLALKFSSVEHYESSDEEEEDEPCPAVQPP